MEEGLRLEIALGDGVRHGEEEGGKEDEVGEHGAEEGEGGEQPEGEGAAEAGEAEDMVLSTEMPKATLKTRMVDALMGMPA